VPAPDEPVTATTGCFWDMDVSLTLKFINFYKSLYAIHITACWNLGSVFRNKPAILTMFVCGCEFLSI